MKHRSVIHKTDLVWGWFGRYLPSPFLLDRPSVLTWIYDQHLQGVIYRRIKDHPALVSPGFKALEKAYYAILAANFHILKAIEELESTLSAYDISVLIFKGAALLTDVYKDPGVRPMEDIDILVRPADRPRVEKALISLGYRHDRNFLSMFEKNGVHIDLHGHPVHADWIGSRDAILNMDINPIWKDSLPWRPGLTHIRKPDSADHLILLSHHMIKHSFSKWIWLYDAYCLLNGFDNAAWEGFAQKTAEYRQERPAAVMLYMLERVFGIKPPEKLSLDSWIKSLSFMEKAILGIKLRGGDIADLGNLLWFFCIRGYGRRLRFLRETIFSNRDAQNSQAGLCSSKTVKADNPNLGRHRLRRIPQNLMILMKGLLLGPSF